MFCLECGSTTNRKSYKYCSNQCHANRRYVDYIEKWRAGLVNGNRGSKSPLLSNHLKRYLIEKYGEKCSSCNWNIRHEVTGKVPLEVNHIDGDALNNLEGNLQLLCPNCHSLTLNFRNLNKGKGRASRRTQK